MVDGFHNVLFPERISLGARGGPGFRTEVASLVSGHEKRNAKWAASRRRFDVGLAVAQRKESAALIAFFEARQGRRYAFRFRDPFDHSTAESGGMPSADNALIGVGDGEARVFQLAKTYASGDINRLRLITLPVAESVEVSVSGAVLLPADYTVDELSGEVTLATAPPLGAEVKAGCLFDIAARFDSDTLALQLEPGGIEVPDIPVVEVRL